MNILYVTHQFPPEYVAGTEILTCQTAKEFLLRRNRITVFSGFPTLEKTNANRSFDFYTYHGIPVYRCHCRRRPGIGWKNPIEDEYNNPFALQCFKRLVEKIKPDIVHVYHLHRLSVNLIDVCKKLGIPSVFSVTDYWFFCPTCQLLLSNGDICEGPDRNMENCLNHLARYAGKANIIKRAPNSFLGTLVRAGAKIKWPHNRFAKIVSALHDRPPLIRSKLALLDRILVPTEFMKKLLIKFGLEQKKMNVVPFGIEYPKKKPARQEFSKNLRIGFIGSLFSHKGAHVLCESVRLLPREKKVEINIYGSLKINPDYVRGLKSTVGDDSRVRFHGSFHPERLFSILTNLDALVVPSLWHENTPLIVHSAQAVNLPVIASDVKGINEVVGDNDNGLLFERGNAENLKRIIQMLCDDREILTRLAERARHPLSMTSYADKLEAIYRELYY